MNGISIAVALGRMIELNQHLRVNVARARPEQLAGMKEAQYGAAAVGQQLAEPCYPFGDFVDLLPLV